ncbi:ubiquinol-cytochrome C chaperone family protein [Sphingomonas sp. 1P06PA]|uniref:ubiquinol-cytochrome C chaperone family protein n=1 Tax=Sphingomonas sp. 1P06PA TaxID=554121 RepID=UPI0039A45777
MSFLRRLFGRPLDREALLPAYQAIVKRARDPWWYRQGQVPDTLDGRFDMVAAILVMVLLRLESEGEATAQDAAWLTELFVDDMDGQLREAGVGDVVVGKHVGRMMGALGGRLSAYRDGLAGGDLEGALTRNLWRGEAPAGAPALVADRLRGFAGKLTMTPADAIAAGQLPA